MSAPESTTSEGSGLRFDDLPPVTGGSTAGAEWWLAFRHLRGGSDTRKVSVGTLVSVIAVVVGVALLNAVIAVMTGFEVDLRDKILGANAHVVVTQVGTRMPWTPDDQQALEQVEGVAAASPFVYSEMMIRSRYGVAGIIIKGVDPSLVGNVTSVQDDLTWGIVGQTLTPEARRDTISLLDTDIEGRDRPALGLDEGEEDRARKPLPAIIIGDELMNQLGVLAGDEVQLINPLGSGSSMFGLPTPSVANYRVAGVFHSGMFEYDNKWTYVGIDDARKLMKLGNDITGVEIKVDDVDGVDEVKAAIEEARGPRAVVRHWRELNSALFEALALEKLVMGLILGMVVVVAGLLIVSNLYMMVVTRISDIAILRAMGASKGTIRRVFILMGIIIGAIGVVFGTLLGKLICAGLEAYQFPFDTDVYLLSSLPVVSRWSDSLVIAVGTMLVCFLSTLYPATKAASMHPVEGLRYE